MDFAKFVSLLDSSCLFFPSAAILDDPFEGSVSHNNINLRKKEPDSIIDDFRPHMDEKSLPNWEEELRKTNKEMHNTMAHMLKWSRQWTYVSCWHLNESESAAMWKLYGMHDQSIAIVSTFKRLKDVLNPHLIPPHGEPKLGLVYYKDYELETVQRGFHLSEYFHKRKSFSHEVELRAVIQELPLKPIPDSANFNYDFSKAPSNGKNLDINLKTLIHEIRISPTSNDWFYELILNIVKKYDLKCSVIRSDLNAEPVY